MLENNFYPMISGFSLRNYSFVEDLEFHRRVKGDIYYYEQCIGTYNPLQISPSDATAYMFIRLEPGYEHYMADWQNYWSYYESYSPDLPKGFGVLLNDLEVLTLLYDFWKTFHSNKGDVIGVINNETIKVVQLKKDYDKLLWNDIIEIFTNKIGITFDKHYPILLFKRQTDFIKTVSEKREHNAKS